MIELIVDTDPGIDDAMALAFLAVQSGIDIKAITTVFGNADIQTTTRNASFLKHRLGISAPVYAGAASPLFGVRGKAPQHVHGEDGLGDTGTLEGFKAQPGTDEAADQIIAHIRAAPGRITLLALGPLTNLALALRRDPGIAALTRQVVIMGGAFGEQGRNGNVTPYAEANIHNDPHAAAEVLAAPWPVTMIGLDVTLSCVLTADNARHMASQSDMGQFLWDISRRYEALYRQNDGLEGCCLHDVAAAIYLLRPDLFFCETGRIGVETGSSKSGSTRLCRDQIGHSAACGVNGDAVAQVFLNALSKTPIVVT